MVQGEDIGEGDCEPDLVTDGNRRQAPPSARQSQRHHVVFERKAIHPHTRTPLDLAASLNSWIKTSLKIPPVIPPRVVLSLVIISSDRARNNRTIGIPSP